MGRVYQTCSCKHCLDPSLRPAARERLCLINADIHKTSGALVSLSREVSPWPKLQWGASRSASLVLLFIRTAKRRHSFVPSSILDWNTLPDHLRCLPVTSKIEQEVCLHLGLAQWGLPPDSIHLPYSDTMGSRLLLSYKNLKNSWSTLRVQVVGPKVLVDLLIKPTQWHEFKESKERDFTTGFPRLHFSLPCAIGSRRTSI